PGGEDHRVEAGAELLHGEGPLPRAAHVDAGAEAGALGAHLLETSVDEALLELELGDAVAHEAAEAVVALEHHHGVARPGQLLGGGEPRRARADHGHGASGLTGR